MKEKSDDESFVEDEKEIKEMDEQKKNEAKKTGGKFEIYRNLFLFINCNPFQNLNVQFIKVNL